MAAARLRRALELLRPRLHVSTPSSRFAEREYAIRVLLDEHLGQSVVVEPGPRDHTEIRRDGSGGTIAVPDGLFAVAAPLWLTPGSLPVEPLTWVSPSEFLDHPCLPFDRTPGIYEPVPMSMPSSSGGEASMIVRIPVDVFGGAFFMLTRYEEAVCGTADEHGRFPAAASLAFRQGFLDVPVVDQYAELLWAALRRLWPRLERRRRAYTLSTSHDLDSPFFVYRAGRFGLTARGLKAVAGDLVRRRDRGLAARRLSAIAGTVAKGARGDPYFNLDAVMEVDEAHRSSATYFVMAGGAGPFGASYSLHDRDIRAFLSRASARGHAIGLHASYESAEDPAALVAESRTLRSELDAQGIRQERYGSRAHYLRWFAGSSFKHMDEAGLDYDSSVSFADHAGFRCGTCHEFSTFDLVRGRRLTLTERPLIAMESSVIDPWYMAMGHGERALGVFTGLAEQCRKYSGTFELLWHNTRLLGAEELGLYNRSWRSALERV